MKWATTMPKEKPTDPEVDQVVFSRRGFHGDRVEFIGKLSRADALEIERQIVEASQKCKSTKKEAHEK